MEKGKTHIDRGKMLEHEPCIDAGDETEVQKTAWKKYPRYQVEVDPDQDDKGKEILLCSFERPHMRAFHCTWWSFFIAFFIWFSITPLMPYIAADLGLTKSDIWTSSIASVGSTIIIRLILGPLCEIFGARILFTAILCISSIPAACTGFIKTAQGLTILRLFIGIAGGSFVTCQYWTSRMFTKEVVGTANGLVAGWGNLGAGVTQLLVGSILLPLFNVFCGDDREMAWRTVCIVPAFVAFVTGVVIFFISDDAPKGNYNELKAHGAFRNKSSPTSSFVTASTDFNTWILFIQYACCFGVELTMNNASILYFRDEFGLSTESASAIAAIFGWLNLFARGLGGFLSDVGNYKRGMRGRLWVQTFILLMEGVMVFIFSNSRSLAGAVVALVFFSFFVQAAEGTSFGVVPYIDPSHMGSVIGIVGAGGNVGAVAFSFAFRQLHYKTAFTIMGLSIVGSCVFSAFIHIKGHAGLFWGKDFPVDNETGELVGPQREENANVDITFSACI